MNLETVNFKLPKNVGSVTANRPPRLDSLSLLPVSDPRRMRMISGEMEIASAFSQELMQLVHQCVWTVQIFEKKQPVLRGD